jgi:2-isopropylmalate synthase
VAATELAVMAGAQRVEGTLFGNGERTGNVDIVALAMNLFSQGIDPELDFRDMDRIADVCERCTKIPVHMRHPYAGELVYTAFSGSHQDAIHKGLNACGEENSGYWEVPYLPIDPADVGRTYETIIRINSQSGKGGVAYVMEKDFGFSLPKTMSPEFAALVQTISERTGAEVLPGMIWDAFENEYLRRDTPFSLKDCSVNELPGEDGPARSSCVEVRASIRINDSTAAISGKGNGPIDAFSNALKSGAAVDFRLLSYHEHALEKGSDSRAAAYILIEDERGKTFFGAGVDASIDIASFKAILSALNRSRKLSRP